MTGIDYARLRELAEKATPGPWIADPPNQWGDHEDIPQSAVRQAEGGSITRDDHSGEVFKPEDAEFIAAFNPETAKALLDEIKRLHSEARVHEQELIERDREIEELGAEVENATLALHEMGIMP